MEGIEAEVKGGMWKLKTSPLGLDGKHYNSSQRKLCGFFLVYILKINQQFKMQQPKFSLR